MNLMVNYVGLFEYIRTLIDTTHFTSHVNCFSAQTPTAMLKCYQIQLYTFISSLGNNPSSKIPRSLRHRLLTPITTREPTPPSIRVDWTSSHVAIVLRLSRFRIITSPHSWEPVLRISCASCRQEVRYEAPDIEDVDQRDDPLEDSADVVVFVFLSDGEDNGERDFGEDEEQLDPEGDAQDAVFAEVDAEALVLGADEDGADNVADTIMTLG